MFIKYKGNPLPRTPQLQIPGWAGQATEDKCQPWHLSQFTQSATAGIELVYPFEDITIPDLAPPFTQVSDLFYLLELDLILNTPTNYSALILPHYRFYTDVDWATPIPTALMIDTDWWPNNLNVLFRMPPPGFKTVFRKGEPFAQVIVVPRSVLRIDELSMTEMDKINESQVYIRNAKNLATREWITSSGYVQNNLYEVLSHLHRQNKLPLKTKKFRIIT